MRGGDFLREAISRVARDEVAVTLFDQGSAGPVASWLPPVGTLAMLLGQAPVLASPSLFFGKLAVVTCGGAFDRKTGSYRDNIVVTAVPVG